MRDPLIATALVTAPRDDPLVDQSIESIVAAGFRRPLVYAEPGSGEREVRSSWHFSHKKLGPWPNWLRALRGLLETFPAADAYAVFQDDIQVATGCAEWVVDQLWPIVPCGILSLYTAQSISQGRNRGWFALGQDELPRRAYGALAVLMPPGAARLLVKSPPGAECQTKADFWLGKFCKDRSLAYVHHNSSLVRHLGITSSLGDRPWTEHRHEGEFLEDVTGLARAERAG